MIWCDLLDGMIDCGHEFERHARSRASAILRQHGQCVCARSIAAHIGHIPAAPAPVISAFRPTANWPHAIASSAMPTAPWARSTASIARDRGAG